MARDSNSGALPPKSGIGILSGITQLPFVHGRCKRSAPAGRDTKAASVTSGNFATSIVVNKEKIQGFMLFRDIKRDPALS